MANQEHLNLLKQGVEVWNQWREEHADLRKVDLHRANLIRADLSGANLIRADLREAGLYRADLRGAHLFKANLFKANLGEADLFEADLSRVELREAHLIGANFSRANLSGADLSETNLVYAKLSYANLSFAHLSRANLWNADLSGANLSGAHLSDTILQRTNLSNTNLSGAELIRAILVNTNLHGATLTNCEVYGASIWDVDLTEAEQSSLIITHPYSDKPIITVDDLEVAQFIYLLLNNPKIREVIDTIGQKAVLILGRFSKERKPVLDALHEKLRTLNYVPIVFDFERPTERDFTETIMTLAGLCRFIIADITNPSSAPLELQATVPNYMIPFVPIIQQGEVPFAMFRDLQSKYSWVLDTLEYDTTANLIKGLERAVVEPALVKHKELMEIKVAKLPTRHIGDYI
jgi:uncharacterized protein YjbI with pentapeptide repeats